MPMQIRHFAVTKKKNILAAISLPPWCAMGVFQTLLGLSDRESTTFVGVFESNFTSCNVQFGG